MLSHDTEHNFECELVLRTRDQRTILRFWVPSLTRDWKGGPFSLHGKLAQGLSLTMRPTRTASPICKFSPQWPETWLSPGSGANILDFFKVLRHVFKNSARFTDIRTRMQRHLQNFIIYFILPKRPFWWTFLFLIEIKSSIALCFSQKIQKLKMRWVDPRPTNIHRVDPLSGLLVDIT